MIGSIVHGNCGKEVTAAVVEIIDESDCYHYKISHPSMICRKDGARQLKLHAAELKPASSAPTLSDVAEAVARMSSRQFRPPTCTEVIWTADWSGEPALLRLFLLWKQHGPGGKRHDVV